MNKCKLKSVLDVRRGLSLPGKFYSNNGEKIRLTLGNFNYPSGGFKKNDSKDNIFFIGEVKQGFILKKGDIITPLTEQVAGLLGETARIPENDLYIQSGDIGLIIPYEDLLDKSFAYYLMMSPIVKKQLSAAAQQTKIRHTSPEKIKDCIVFLPSLAQQKSIGNLLDLLNSKIDLNNKINTDLEALAKLIYDYWFVQFDFPNENGKPYKSSGGKMVWNKNLKREIPEDWKNATLSEIANITMGQSPPGNSYNKDGIGTFFYQGCTDFGNRYPTIRQYTNSPSRFAKFGDILLSVRAPVGDMNIANHDCCIGRGLAALNSKIGAQGFLYEVMKYFKQVFNLRNGNGTTFGSITKDDLYSLPLAYPNNKLVIQFEEIISPIYKKQNLIEVENQGLIMLRDWLLPMLMNGQVTVGD